jgi:hypothetical protein
VQLGRYPGQVRVRSEHGVEHGHRSARVALGAVSVFVFLPALEAQSGGQVAPLACVENGLGVEDGPVLPA